MSHPPRRREKNIRWYRITIQVNGYLCGALDPRLEACAVMHEKVHLRRRPEPAAPSLDLTDLEYFVAHATKKP